MDKAVICVEDSELNRVKVRTDNKFLKPEDVPEAFKPEDFNEIDKLTKEIAEEKELRSTVMKELAEEIEKKALEDASLSEVGSDDTGADPAEMDMHMFAFFVNSSRGSLVESTSQCLILERFATQRQVARLRQSTLRSSP